MKLRVVITGRSYDQAAELPEQIELAENATIDDALAAINLMLGDQQLASSCLVALQGNHLGTVAQHQDSPLVDGQELVLLQPVAGG